MASPADSPGHEVTRSDGLVAPGLTGVGRDVTPRRYVLHCGVFPDRLETSKFRLRHRKRNVLVNSFPAKELYWCGIFFIYFLFLFLVKTKKRKRKEKRKHEQF